MKTKYDINCRFKNKKNQWFTIIEIINKRERRIRFDDGAELVINISNINGNILHPSDKAEKHGDRWTRLYRIWLAMRWRCNKNNKNECAKTYYEKGIKVCDEWNKSYLKFKEWALQNGYKDNLTIDRINNDGNYEPSNCQWITLSENASKSNREKVSNKVLMINVENNEKHIFDSVSEASRYFHIDRSTLRKRLNGYNNYIYDKYLLYYYKDNGELAEVGIK